MVIRYPITSFTDNAIIGRDRVVNRLKYLFFTKEGERPMLPDYGITLEQFLFDNNIESRKSEIESYIFQKIKYWVPEINEYYVTAEINSDDERLLVISVNYVYSGYKSRIEWSPSENVIREY